MDSTRINNATEYKMSYFGKTKTQCEMVFEYIELYGSITPIEAFYGINCMRLGARIADLRAEGYDIRTEIASGADKHYAIYSLADGKEHYAIYSLADGKEQNNG